MQYFLRFQTTAWYLLSHLKGEKSSPPFPSQFLIVDITLDKFVTDAADEYVTD
jgi:hypothetical protein